MITLALAKLGSSRPSGSRPSVHDTIIYNVIKMPNREYVFRVVTHFGRYLMQDVLGPGMFRAIQELSSNTVGGGRVSDFPEKRVTKIMLQRYSSVTTGWVLGRCRISRKKELRNT